MEAQTIDAKNVKKVGTVPTGGLANRAAGAAHETIDEFRGKAKKAEQRLVRKAQAGGRSMTNRASGVVQTVTTYVEEKPFAAVILAFGLGVLVSTMLRSSGVNLARLLTPPPSPPADDGTG